jgi:SET domain-containing protein
MAGIEVPIGTKQGRQCSESMSEQQLTKLPGRALPITARGPLAVADFGDRGRGVVALEDIEHGQLIERSPVLIIPSHERPAVDNTVIFTYVFMWEHLTVEQDLYDHRGRSAIALGYTSLLSHSFEPNCNFVRHIDALLIDVFAKRAIRAGEELTIDYQMTLWFNPVRI